MKKYNKDISFVRIICRNKLYTRSLRYIDRNLWDYSDVFSKTNYLNNFKIFLRRNKNE